MQKFLFVFIGSGIGGVIRYAISLGFNPLSQTKFPWATFGANCLAALLVGVFFAIAANKSWLSSSSLLLLTTGLCGGLSTFSTFSHETFKLWQSQDYLMGSVYVIASILACLLFVFIGSKLIQ